MLSHQGPICGSPDGRLRSAPSRKEAFVTAETSTDAVLEIPEDPANPFGIVALPDPLLPITDEGLARAYSAMLAYFDVPAALEERKADKRSVGNQIEKAYTLVRDPLRWEITPDTVIIHSESGCTYRVRPDFCEGPQRISRGKPTTICPGFSRGTVGCYHQLAAEMLRLAQVFASVDHEAPTPIFELPGFAALALFGAVSIALKHAQEDDISLSVSAEYGNVSLAYGPYTVTVPAVIEGDWLFNITPQSFQAAWQSIKPHALNAERLAILTDMQGDTGMLTFAGGAINVSVPVTGMQF
jgi:hypothetical protein